MGDTVFLTERLKSDQTKFLVRKAIVKELKFSQKENDILEYQVKFCDNHETKSCYMYELLNNEKLARDAVDMANSSLKDYEDFIRLGVIRGRSLRSLTLAKETININGMKLEFQMTTGIFILNLEQ